MERTALLAIAVVLALAVGQASASQLDDELDRRLKGAWAVLEVEVWSSCSGTYSDNTIGAAGVASKADRRFEPGELVKIDKIKVKRARVDLLTTLAVPVLVAHRDGPFELWEERQCQAQLIFEVGRTAIKSRDADQIMGALMSVMSTHSSRDAAQDSDDWNDRERKPYPPGYEQTLARYERWKAEETNAAVAAGIERSIGAAAAAAEDIENDPDYLAGFAEGAEEMQEIYLSDCTSLIDASFASRKENPPSGKSKTWKRGFSDGQRVVFHTRLAHELQSCYVPVPRSSGP